MGTRTRPHKKAASIVLVVCMGMTLLAVSPPTAGAHSFCSNRTSVSGVIGSILAAINVFDPVVELYAECAEQFENVDVKMFRDYATESDRSFAGANGTSNARCINGMAAIFPCNNVDLVAHVPHAELGTTFVNDMWGWVDRGNRTDYLLVGAAEGTVFVRIQNDYRRPEVMGILPTASDEGGVFWRDIKVFNEHAFIVSEHDSHGVQIFDLTKLRDWDTGDGYQIFEHDALYDGVGSAHNIAINEETGYAYVVGAANFDQTAASCNFGLHMLDVNDPKNPIFAGCMGDSGYVHDAQCVIYTGEDAEHVGKEICINSNGLEYVFNGENYLLITDVTDKDNPIEIARVPYEGNGYSHQGWLTPNQRFFIHGDEGDEFLGNLLTTSRVWNVRDLDNPYVQQVYNFEGTTSIDHNVYTEGRWAYHANYTTGLRITDIRGISTNGLSEVAFFDVYPENDARTFEGGAWNNWPYMRWNNMIAISSMDRGLFIVRARLNGVGR